MNVLFICSLNRIRSLTAEQIFSRHPGLHVRSAGTQRNARVVLNSRLLSWADTVFVMEREHKEKLEKDFPQEVQEKKIIVLDIPNGFGYMEPELIDMIERTVSEHI